MPHQPTVTKNFRNTQSEFGSYLGSCDVSMAPRAVRLSTSSGTQLLLLPKGNSEVPLFFHFLNYPLYVCKPSKNCNPAALTDYKALSVYSTVSSYVEDEWPCAGGLSAVNAIGTRNCVT